MRKAATRGRRAPRRAGTLASNRTDRRARTLIIALAVGILLGGTRPAHAFGLVDAYEGALAHDPVYAGAIKEKEAGEANRAIGRSYLLPQLSANYSNYREWTHTTYFGSQYGAGGTLDQQYHAYSEGVSLRQPLINLEGLARYRYGKAMALASDATLTDRGEELLVRVLTAYTDTLFALDQLTLATAQTRTLEEQLAANEAMLKNGEGTRTDILETTAKLELARADVTEARDALDSASHTLEALTGLPASLSVAGLERLSDGYSPELPSPASYEQWSDIARDSNAELIAERHSVEAARQQVRVAQSGFYPRVDLVASLGKNQSSTIDTIGQRYFTKMVGVEVTIPLYSGGMVKASSQQANANYERMQFELQDKTSKVMLEVRKQYNLCLSSSSRIQALRRAVESATLLITASRKSAQAGMRTNLDILLAEQQLYQARRDLARARYQNLIANLQLKHAAGILTVEDLYGMARWFVPAARVAPIATATGAKGEPLHLVN